MAATSTFTQPLPAERKLREIHHWINGQTLTGSSGRFGDVFNPASGKLQARVALAPGRRFPRFHPGHRQIRLPDALNRSVKPEIRN